MSALPISGPSATKRRGRPLAGRTVAIREAILALTERYERMTVRGIFYALVGPGVVPKDDTTGYRPVQRQVLALRREGLLPWGFVADGTRWMRRVTTYGGVDDALREVSRSYRRDLWRSQNLRVEIWLEKDALADLLWPVAEEWGVPLAVSRGCPSATYVYNAALDARRAAERGCSTWVFALYDFDAGGDRAFRSICTPFYEIGHCFGAASHVERLALSEDQIDEWDLPTRPGKASDPEARKWGDRPCVELDAVAPDELTSLVDTAIRGLVDERAWEVEAAFEAEERAGLEALINGWAS